MSTITADSRARSTWEQAIADVKAIRDLIGLDAVTERWNMAGSVRRRELTVGDVEYVAIPRYGQRPGEGLFAEPRATNLLWERLDELVEAGELEQARYGVSGTTRWGDRYRGVCFRGYKHEFFLATPDTFGYHLAIRTGPADYSRFLVTALQRQGLRGIDGEVIDQRTGELVCCPEESDFFAAAGVELIEPRCRGR